MWTVGYVRVRESGEGEIVGEMQGKKTSSSLVCARLGKEEEAQCCSK